MAALGQGVKDLAPSQDDFKAAVFAQIGGLADQIQQLLSDTKRKDPVPIAPEPSPRPTFAYTGAGVRLASPDQYSGDLGQCKSFLINCDMHFELSSQQFLTDQASGPGWPHRSRYPNG